MEAPEYKKVLIVSNSCSQSNTLSKFVGNIPNQYLENHKSWSVSVESCGLHLSMKNGISPQDNLYPILLQVTHDEMNEILTKFNIISMNDLKLQMFNCANKIYIDSSRTYTLESLTQEIRNKIFSYAYRFKKYWCGVPIEYNKNLRKILIGQFLYEDEFKRLTSKEEKDKKRTFVFIHDRFKEKLLMEKEDNLNSCMIDNELYHWFFNSLSLKEKDFYPLKCSATYFPVTIPKLVQILSKNVEPSICNGENRNCLRQFAIDDKYHGTFIQKEFESTEFSKINTSEINSFEIEYCDENFQKLKLKEGLPSYVKLLFSPKMFQQEIVRLSSISNRLFQNNVFGDFSVQLPRELNFQHRKCPRVALTSISFENKFEILHGLSLDIVIVNLDDNERFEIKVPKNSPDLRSNKSIRDWVLSEISNTGVVESSVKSNRLDLTFNKACIMIIGSSIGNMLGFDFVDKNSKNNSIHISSEGQLIDYFFSQSETANDEEWKSKIKETIDFYQMRIRGVEADEKAFFTQGDIAISSEKNLSFHVPNYIKTIELFPKVLNVYTNIIQPSVTAGEFKKLLRVNLYWAFICR